MIYIYIVCGVIILMGIIMLIKQKREDDKTLDGLKEAVDKTINHIDTYHKLVIDLRRFLSSESWIDKYLDSELSIDDYFSKRIKELEGADDHFNIINSDIITPLKKIICSNIGHDITVDQCRLPEHDYCVCCGDLFPGQASDRTR